MLLGTARAICLRGRERRAGAAAAIVVDVVAHAADHLCLGKDAELEGVVFAQRQARLKAVAALLDE